MRHGETDTNRNHIWQGSQDIPLNEMGREQAREASSIIDEIRPEVVVTSNLSRAIETGEIASQHSRNARFIIDPDLRERNCGTLEGLTSSEIKEKFGVFMNMTSRDIDGLPGVEPYQAFTERIHSALQKTYSKYEGKRVLVVSHGGVLRSFYETSIGGYLPNGMVFNNCAILSLRLMNGKWSILDKYNTLQI